MTIDQVRDAYSRRAEEYVDVVGRIEHADEADRAAILAWARYPAARFRRGRAEQLGVPDGSTGGVLAWFSLIHTDPSEVDVALREIARSLRMGGSLMIGFFDGPAREAFDHAVVTAYFWSVDAMTEVVEGAGLTVADARTRHDPPARPQGFLVAHKIA